MYEVPFKYVMSTLFQPVNACGEPPWFVYLMVNLGSKSAKQTEISIHSDPVLVETAQNQFHSCNNEIWHIIMFIGPFTNWDKTCHFATAWSKDTRGTKSRIFRGFVLYSNFYMEEQLRMYVTKIIKRDAIQNLINKMCEHDIYGVIIKCNPEEYNKNSSETYVSHPKLKYLKDIHCSIEDSSKLAYWSEGNLIFRRGEYEIDFTRKTLAWVFDISSKKPLLDVFPKKINISDEIFTDDDFIA